MALRLMSGLLVLSPTYCCVGSLPLSGMIIYHLFSIDLLFDAVVLPSLPSYKCYIMTAGNFSKQ